MVHTIRWMVMREPASRRSLVGSKVLVTFLLGGLIGGGILGSVVSLVGIVLNEVARGAAPRLGAVAAVMVYVLYVTNRLDWWRPRFMGLRNQVPEAWRDMFAPGVASFIYAGVLGLSIFTYISSFAFFSLLALLLGLGAWPWVPVAALALMGLLRASTALLVPLSRWAEQPAERVTEKLDSWDSRARTIEGWTLVLSSLVLLVWTAT